MQHIKDLTRKISKSNMGSTSDPNRECTNDDEPTPSTSNAPLQEDQSDDLALIIPQSPPPAESIPRRVVIPPSPGYQAYKRLGDVVDEVTIYIFSYLSEKELLRVGHTCKRWRELSSYDMFWVPVYSQFSGVPIRTLVLNVQPPQQQSNNNNNNTNNNTLANAIDNGNNNNNNNVGSSSELSVDTLTAENADAENNATPQAQLYTYLYTQAYRDKYIETKQHKYTERRRRRNIKRKLKVVGKTSSACEVFFAHAAPTLMWLSLITVNVMFPLLLDGFIVPTSENILLCMLPLFVGYVAPYFGLLIFSIIDPLVIKHAIVPWSRAIRETIYDADKPIVVNINMFAWGMHFIPISLLCAAIKLISFPDVSWSEALIPLFVLGSLYVAVGMIFCIWTCCNDDDDENNHAIIYVICSLMIVVYNLQVGLVCGKLDGVISSSWTAVFTPMWIVFSINLLVLCIAPCLCCCSSDLAFGAFGVGIIGNLYGAPLLAFFITIAVRLDYAGFLFIYPWIGLWIFLIATMLFNMYITASSDVANQELWREE